MDSSFFHAEISVNVLVDRGVELLDKCIVAGLNGVGYAVLKVILENDARGAVECGANCGELNENVGAVALVLDHALYRFKMADGACEPVYDRFALRVGVRVVVVRVLMLLVLRYIFTRGFLMTVDYAVAVVMIKAVVRSVHTVPPKN